MGKSGAPLPQHATGTKYFTRDMTSEAFLRATGPGFVRAINSPKTRTPVKLLRLSITQHVRSSTVTISETFDPKSATPRRGMTHRQNRRPWCGLVNPTATKNRQPACFRQHSSIIRTSKNAATVRIHQNSNRTTSPCP